MLRNSKYVVILFSVFGLAVLSTWIVGMPNPEKIELVRTSLLGVCLDGLIFAGILDLIERNREDRRIQRLKNTLLAELSFMSEVLKNCLLQSDVSRSLMTNDNKAIATSLNDIKVRIGSEHGPDYNNFVSIAKNVATGVKSKAGVHLTRLRNITSVAAQVDQDFLADWMNVTDKLYSVTQDEGFDAETLRYFPGVEWTYAYNQLIALFLELDTMQVPPYRSPVTS